MTEWSDLFNVLIFGEGAIIGLMLVAALGFIVAAKAKESGIVFMMVSMMMCILVITNAGNDIEILTGVGYAFLTPVFLLLALKGKNSAF